MIITKRAGLSWSCPTLINKFEKISLEFIPRTLKRKWKRLEDILIHQHLENM